MTQNNYSVVIGRGRYLSITNMIDISEVINLITTHLCKFHGGLLCVTFCVCLSVQVGYSLYWLWSILTQNKYRLESVWVVTDR